jgi:hypothetical protein
MPGAHRGLHLAIAASQAWTRSASPDLVGALDGAGRSVTSSPS